MKELSESLIEAGKKLIRALDAAGLEVAAGLWAYLPETQRWRLVIASPDVETKGPTKVYRQIFSVIGEEFGQDVPFEIDDISVITDDHELVRPLRGAKSTPEKTITGTRLTGEMIGGRYIDDVYVYRPLQIDIRPSVTDGRALLRLVNRFPHSLKITKLFCWPPHAGAGKNLLHREVVLGPRGEITLDITEELRAGHPVRHEWLFRLDPHFEEGEQPFAPPLYRARLEDGAFTIFEPIRENQERRLERIAREVITEIDPDRLALRFSPIRKSTTDIREYNTWRIALWISAERGLDFEVYIPEEASDEEIRHQLEERLRAELLET